ncbi:MAG: hypothetical protein H0T51_07775 [Pirellulales bacterium]|nr:hypothetical protein [Pirellulales bacterium]
MAEERRSELVLALAVGAVLLTSLLGFACGRTYERELWESRQPPPIRIELHEVPAPAPEELPAPEPSKRPRRPATSMARIRGPPGGNRTAQFSP